MCLRRLLISSRFCSLTNYENILSNTTRCLSHESDDKTKRIVVFVHMYPSFDAVNKILLPHSQMLTQTIRVGRLLSQTKFYSWVTRKGLRMNSGKYTTQATLHNAHKTSFQYCVAKNRNGEQATADYCRVSSLATLELRPRLLIILLTGWTDF